MKTGSTSYARTFCRRPTSLEAIASEQSLCSASIESAVLVLHPKRVNTVEEQS